MLSKINKKLLTVLLVLCVVVVTATIVKVGPQQIRLYKEKKAATLCTREYDKLVDMGPVPDGKNGFPASAYYSVVHICAPQKIGYANRSAIQPKLDQFVAEYFPRDTE